LVIISLVHVVTYAWFCLDGLEMRTKHMTTGSRSEIHDIVQYYYYYALMTKHQSMSRFPSSSSSSHLRRSSNSDFLHHKGNSLSLSPIN